MKKMMLIEAINKKLDECKENDCICSASEYSELTGMERNEVYQQLGKLKESGVIDIKRKRIGDTMQDIITITNLMYRD